MGTGFERVEAQMDSGKVPDLFEWDDLQPSVLILTGGAFLTVHCHEWRGYIGPCHGLDCWHCSEKAPHTLLGLTSAVVFLQGEGAPFHAVGLVEIAGEENLNTVLKFCPHKDTLRETVLLITGDGKIADGRGHIQYNGNLPGALEPLTFALRFYGPHSVYCLAGPSFQAPIAPHHLPRPANRRAYTIPGCRGGE